MERTTLMMLDLQKKLKANKHSAIYLLFGKESHLINEAISHLIKSILKDEERDFNLSTYDLEETPIDIPIEDAQTLPFFGDKRIVIMKNANFLTSAKTSWSSEFSC
jgi:DNA polymerase III subunit delta